MNIKFLVKSLLTCVWLSICIFALNSDITNAAIPETNLFRNVLKFDGDNDYAFASDQTELDVGDEPGESFTIEFWVQFDPFTQSDLLLKSAENDFGYRIYTLVEYIPEWGYGRCLGYQYQDQAWGHSCNYGTKLADNIWHHVAVIFNADLMQHTRYLDGKQWGGTNDYFNPLNNSSAPLEIGKGLSGYIEELRISKYVRYSGDSFSVPTTPFECDEHTLALWHFDESKEAIVFQDACGENNFLTSQNGTHTVQIHNVYLPVVVK